MLIFNKTGARVSSKHLSPPKYCTNAFLSYTAHKNKIGYWFRLSKNKTDLEKKRELRENLAIFYW
jgi:hypothetical protein